MSYSFDFKPEELLMKVREHTVLLKQLERTLQDHVADDKENFKEMKVICDELSKSVRDLNSNVEKLVNRAEGAMWASAKFWAIVLFVASTSFSVAKYIKIG